MIIEQRLEQVEQALEEMAAIRVEMFQAKLFAYRL